jgi:hypothetical protein
MEEVETGGTMGEASLPSYSSEGGEEEKTGGLSCISSFEALSLVDDLQIQQKQTLQKFENMAGGGFLWRASN